MGAIRHQEHIAVSIEGQQLALSKAQDKKLREMDERRLNPGVIDAVLSQEKKKKDFDVVRAFCK